MKVARSLPARLLGLLFAPAGMQESLLLIPCHDIHTFGMRQAIDVAFVSKDGLVLESHRGLQPCKRLRCKGAFATLERLSAPNLGAWPEAGQRIDIQTQLHRKERR